jgi:hypothetical protein
LTALFRGFDYRWQLPQAKLISTATIAEPSAAASAAPAFSLVYQRFEWVCGSLYFGGLLAASASGLLVVFGELAVSGSITVSKWLVVAA